MRMAARSVFSVFVAACLWTVGCGSDDKKGEEDAAAKEIAADAVESADMVSEVGSDLLADLPLELMADAAADIVPDSQPELLVDVPAEDVLPEIACDGCWPEDVDQDVCANDGCPAPCVPDCTFKVCGEDGCGGSCGECGVGFACDEDAGTCSCETLAPPAMGWELPLGGESYDRAHFVTALADGSYLAVGRTASSGTGEEDFHVVRITETGGILWKTTIGGEQQEIAWRAAEAANGDILVVGPTKSYGAGDSDWWVVRLDAEGNVLWDKTYGGELGDSVNSITPMDGGYLLAGFTRSKGAGDKDAWVMAIDEEGETLWDNTFGGEGGDHASFAVVLEDGYAFCGWTNSQGEGGEDVWLVRLDLDGQLLWEQTFGGPAQDIGYALSALPDGGFLIAGDTSSKGSGGADAWVVRTNAAGEVEWDKTYGGPAGEHANRMALTGDLGFVLSGWTGIPGGAGVDAWLLRLDSDGEVRWSFAHDTPQDSSAEWIQPMNDGSFLLAGWLRDGAVAPPDFWLARTLNECCQPYCEGKTCGDDGCGGTCGQCDDDGYCCSGSCVAPQGLWSVAYGDNGYDRSEDLAVDGNGNVFVVGNFGSATLQIGDDTLTRSGDVAAFVARLDSLGVPAWAQAFTGTGLEYGHAVAVSAAGLVAVGGEYSSADLTFGQEVLPNEGGADGFVVVLDNDGNVQWTAHLGGAGADKVAALAFGGDDSVVVGGWFNSETLQVGDVTLTNAAAGANDVFVARYDSEGSLLWAVSGGGPGGDVIGGLDADETGAVVAVGWYDGATFDIGGKQLANAGKADIFLFGLAPDGTLRWASGYGGEENDKAVGVATGDAGSIFVTGAFSSPQLALGLEPLVNQGFNDVFVARFDTAGHNVWALQFGAEGHDGANEISLGAFGEVLVTGEFDSQSISVDGQPLMSSGGKDIYVLRLDADGNHLWSNNYDGSADSASEASAASADGSLFHTGWFSGSLSLDDSVLESAGAVDFYVAKLAGCGE